MYIDFLFETFEENKNKPAIVWKDTSITYKDLLALYNKVANVLDADILRNKVVALEADFSRFQWQPFCI